MNPFIITSELVYLKHDESKKTRSGTNRREIMEQKDHSEFWKKMADKKVYTHLHLDPDLNRIRIDYFFA